MAQRPIRSLSELMDGGEQALPKVVSFGINTQTQEKKG